MSDNGKKARDIMRPLEQFPRVALQYDMLKVVRLMFAFHKEGKQCNVAVVEDREKPVGLITMRNIFEVLEPKSFHISSWSVSVFWEGLWTQRVRNLKEKRVYNVFTPNEMINVQVDHNLMRVMHFFNRSKMPAVAVLDGQTMVGVIEAVQVFREVLQEAEEID